MRFKNKWIEIDDGLFEKRSIVFAFWPKQNDVTGNWHWLTTMIKYKVVDTKSLGDRWVKYRKKADILLDKR